MVFFSCLKKGWKMSTNRKQYAKKTQEELKLELDETLSRLEQGVRNVFTSDKYLEYLRFFAKMHNYSFNNTILILSQLPTASLCASYQTWKSLKCPVKKGQKGLSILVPIPYKQERLVSCTDGNGHVLYNADGSEKTEKVYIDRLFFRIGKVFDISQCDGELPTLSNELTGSQDCFAQALTELMQNSDIPIAYDNSLSGSSTNGYYHIEEHRIALRCGMSTNQCMKTLIHEKAHSLLHGKDGNHYTRNEAEVQAESIAFVVSEILGLDTSSYSFGYIASWSSGKELKELQQSLSVIEKTSKEILTWITNNSSLSIATPLAV